MEPLVRSLNQSRSPFGASGSIHPKRADLDFYPTPPEAIRALLSVEQFDGTIWEPACGDGAISRELASVGYEVVSTDIADHGFGDSGIDFLRERSPRAKHVITNPPYGRGLADQFVRHALALTRQTGGSVAMLLNLASLSHPPRHKLFVENPPAAIYAFDQLVCYPNGIRNEAIARANNQRYCWIVWKADHAGRPTFWWLSAKEFI
jgi:predicted RNA methylase